MGKYDPGAVYILNEEDENKNRTEYYKIGLVGPTKTVQERIKQHQTGNPRKIINVHSFDSLAPHFVEGHLHKRFGIQRGSGEWFKLSGKELQDVIDEAARYEKIIGPEVSSVRDLHHQPSNGQSATLSTAEQKNAEKIHAKLVVIEVELQAIAFHESIHKLNFKLATGNNEGGIDGITSFTISGGGAPKFQTSLFIDSSPANEAIYNQFCTKRSITGSKMKTVISQTKAKNHPKLHEAEKAATAAFEANKPAIGGTVQKTVKRTSSLEKQHEDYINLLQHKEELEEQKFMCHFELMKLCGSNDQIDGICTWVRKEKFAFDQVLFKKLHPELFADTQYYAAIIKPPTISIGLNGARDYV